MVFNQPRPDDVDAAGVSIPMNAQQQRALVDQQIEYDKLENIAYSELMKACRANPKTKKQAILTQLLTFFIVFVRDTTTLMR